MRRAAYVGWCCVALGLACAGARAQSAAADAKPAGAVSGRVTSDGKGAAGVVVMVYGLADFSRPRAAGRATTDEEGRYTVAGLPAGQYRVSPFAPAFYVEEWSGGGWPPGTSVNVSAGETIEGVNFSLTRGGVITGRVLDADGRPLVGQRVMVTPADSSPPRPLGPQILTHNTTDDRGVYRLFGLPPGRYHVSTGEGGQQQQYTAFPGPQRVFTRTFHPNAAEAAEATVVELTAGGEATDVDITVAAAAKTYKLSGRLVDADTGQPLADQIIHHGPLVRGSERMTGGTAVTRTNARGEFKFETLLPGRYGAYASPDRGVGDWYGETVTFDVTDSDVTGLELKARRGASVSGVVTVEGANDRALLARLAGAEVYGIVEVKDDAAMSTVMRARVEPDGSFRLAGLRPGRVRFRLGGRQPPKGFSLVRVERGGAAAGDGFEVAAGEQVAGVRLVFGYGAGVIRGQVVYDGGPLPADARVAVNVRGVGSDLPVFGGRDSSVDSRGRFVFEGLRAGEYEVSVRVFRRVPGARPLQGRQQVVVGASGETQVTITLDSSP